MQPAPQPQPASLILLEEYFSTENDAFLGVLRAVSAAGWLASFVERWKKDPRSWARRMMLAYAAMPLSCEGHEVVVKRLFKHAEAVHDTELVGAWMAAFDRSIRRVRGKEVSWNRGTRSYDITEVLKLPANGFRGCGGRDKNGRWIRTKVRQVKQPRLFSYITRYYLQRRAWRYFRRLAFQKPAEYIPAVCRALARYQESDFTAGEHLLDSWGFMHACYMRHPALRVSYNRITVREDGPGLASLTPAPAWPHLWENPEAVTALAALTGQAGSRAVRSWAMTMLQDLRQRHPVPVSLADLRTWLDSQDEELQAFALSMLRSHPDLAAQPVEFWLGLLALKQTTLLPAVVQLFHDHVAPARLDLAAVAALACAAPSPVARLGLDLLKQRSIATAADRAVLTSLAAPRCEALAGEAAAFALSHLGSAAHYDPVHALRFLDSLSAPVREAAWTWLSDPSGPGYDDALLWSRLSETPWDDLKLRIVRHLDRRASLVEHTGDLAPLWTAVLLGVHRGGREKLRAVHQAGAAIAADRARAVQLLPVLGSAVRSIRGPERRAALSAVATLLARCPDLRPDVSAVLPELVTA